ncbi:MAG: hypothetical protein ABJN42_06335, partial [Roseibium sp.]|uniref:hypothetical protein n=1 Tax=Roseibium sp. TaxID=1936156 RepID=UPI003299FD0B
AIFAPLHQTSPCRTSPLNRLAYGGLKGAVRLSRRLLPLMPQSDQVLHSKLRKLLHTVVYSIKTTLNQLDDRLVEPTVAGSRASAVSGGSSLAGGTRFRPVSGSKVKFRNATSHK